jgi:hypothetical protein
VARAVRDPCSYSCSRFGTSGSVGQRTRLAKLKAIVAESRLFAEILLRGDPGLLRSDRRDRGQRDDGGDARIDSVARGYAGGNSRGYGRRVLGERAETHGGCVAAVSVARAQNHSGAVAWIVLAAIVGAMFAGFLALSSMRAPSVIRTRRLDPSHYAVPVEPGIERTSALADRRIVSNVGW